MNTQQTPSSLGTYLGVLQRRRIYLLTVLPAALLLAVYLAYSLPAIYRSSARTLTTDFASRTARPQVRM